MDTYKRAWEGRDDALLCSLFAADGVYHNTPFDQQVGHAAISRRRRRHVKFAHSIDNGENAIPLARAR